ncbi:MAG: hypothetical protein KJ592_03560 [Nanoarchaeota archaeon]|nr:hypothetical protein [Nanoarchaeota archaeon]
MKIENFHWGFGVRCFGVSDELADGVTCNMKKNGTRMTRTNTDKHGLCLRRLR